MKFIADANPKKVRISAETAAEEAWVSTLKESAKRIARGAERFALTACAEWIRANGGSTAVAAKAAKSTPGIASLAAAWGASTNATPAPQWRQGATVAAAKAKAATVRAEKRGGASASSRTRSASGLGACGPTPIIGTASMERPPRVA